MNDLLAEDPWRGAPRRWRALRAVTLAAALGVAALALAAAPAPAAVPGVDVQYSSAADFGRGDILNLDLAEDALRLVERSEPLPFIWVALSDRGTIIRVNTETGAILGEYRTTPDGAGGFGGNPSRTTVALDGSVWSGNRNVGALVRVGLREANQCVDRNGNGLIDTSTGYGDVLPWPNAGGVDSDGGVETAADECLLTHVRRPSSSDVRHVSVNADDDVWISGSTNREFRLIDGGTGAALRTVPALGCGGYGGLIDRDGVVWSATPGSFTYRLDPDAPITAGDPAVPDDQENPRCVSLFSYGLALDTGNALWASSHANTGVLKRLPDGTVLGPFDQHDYGPGTTQGLAVDGNGHVWTSSQIGTGRDGVGHLLNDGTFLGDVPNPGGTGSTGVAVDAAGKVWTANRDASSLTRIDPAKGTRVGPHTVGEQDLLIPLGSTPGRADDPGTPQDETVPPLPAAGPYNYSDMTGRTLLTATRQGTWSVVQDGGDAGHRWGRVLVDRRAGSQGGVTTEIRAADSPAGLGAQPFAAVGDDGAFSATGRFLEVRITVRPPAAEGAPGRVLDPSRTPVIDAVRICDLAVACSEPVVAPAQPTQPAGTSSTPEAAAPIRTAATVAAALQCTTRRLVLIDVAERGNRVVLSGAADARYVGQAVDIVFRGTGKRVARARVAPDGTFRATAPPPARHLRATDRARYQARIGGERSLNLKLRRRMVVDGVRVAGGKVTIRGRVRLPLSRPARTIEVRRRVSCGRTAVVARVRPDRRGRFSVTVAAPPSQRAAVYRLATRVPYRAASKRLQPTFTLPTYVDLNRS